jgi:glycosyltransferase involved in cell wall biosynthesis
MMKILFLATYFPKPLNPTIGTWALEQAKAFHAMTSPPLEGKILKSCNAEDVELRVVSGTPWFPKVAGLLKAGIRAYSHCQPRYDWDSVRVEYPRMLFYPFGKFDSLFNRIGEPLLALGWWSFKTHLLNVVNEFQPDVVYAHHTVPNGYFAMKIKQSKGIPFVVTDHEMGEIIACEHFPARKSVYEKVIREAYRMVSVAGVMQRDMLQVFPQAQTEVIHNGMNVTPKTSRAEGQGSRATESRSASLDARRSTLDPSFPKPLVVLSCGMFYERKNFPGLIRAFNLVAAQHGNVVLRIFGDGPDRLKVEQERKRSPVNDRIEILGKVAHAEVLRQMQEADIFALIGWREPFGVVFLEAMSAGLPVVACDDGGIADVITSVNLSRVPQVEVRQQAEYGHVNPTQSGLQHANNSSQLPNGILVPPRNIEAAARAMEFLIENPEARFAIGQTAKAKVEADFTWDAVVKKYLVTFKDAVKANETRLELVQ